MRNLISKTLATGACMAALTSSTAHAGLILDSNLLYRNSSTKTTTTESTSNYSVSGFIGASIPKAYFIGWKTTLFKDTLTTANGSPAIHGLEMGPRLGVFFGKEHWTSLSATYLPVHSGTYVNSAGNSYSLTGTGYELEFTFAPLVFANLSPGFSLLYHLGSYSSQTDPSNNTTQVSYTRNGFYPSFFLHFEFGAD